MSGDLRFLKFEGCGNHFLVVDEIRSQRSDWTRICPALCNPYFGVGGDGVMLVRRSGGPADFSVGMLNPDGSPMGMCGNGIRCVTRFIVLSGLLTPGRDAVRFDVEGRVIRCRLADAGEGRLVEVNMGMPAFAPDDIPMKSPFTPSPGEFINQPIDAGGAAFHATAVSMGNPHCVIFEAAVSRDRCLKYGPLLETHPLFPSRTNVEFVAVSDRHTLQVEVWERGAGATMACGTGACASLVAAVRNGLAERHAKILLPGGALSVVWDQKSNEVLMTGPANEIYEGRLCDSYLERLSRSV